MFCLKCGSSQSAEAMFCAKCGTKIQIEPDFEKPMDSAVLDVGTPDRLIVAPKSVAPIIPSPANRNAERPQLNEVISTSTKPSFGLMRSTVVFVGSYLLCMLPTYYLPYLGSNSTLVQGMSAAVNGRTMGSFWIHLAFSAALIGIAFCRAPHINKQWLPSIPVMAAFFDLTPGLSSIPLVPTGIHVMAVVFGASGTINEAYKANFMRAAVSVGVVSLLFLIGLFRLGAGPSSGSAVVKSNLPERRSAVESVQKPSPTQENQPEIKSSPATAKPTQNFVPSWVRARTASTDRTNVRTGPGADAQVATQLLPNVEIELETQQGSEWYRVRDFQSKAILGYVREDRIVFPGH
jgi:hypothetical protein